MTTSDTTITPEPQATVGITGPAGTPLASSTDAHTLRAISQRVLWLSTAIVSAANAGRPGAAVQALSVGPADTDAQIGALVSAKAQANVTAMVDRAVTAGAR